MIQIQMQIRVRFYGDGVMILRRLDVQIIDNQIKIGKRTLDFDTQRQIDPIHRRNIQMPHVTGGNNFIVIGIYIFVNLNTRVLLINRQRRCVRMPENKTRLFPPRL